jgi:hypothetical protein
MGRFLDKFLEFKNEADATRKFALFAVIIITLGLASLSVTGIVATADWSWMSFLPIVGMIIAVLGAELLATVAFIRMLTASTPWRKVAGAFIFIGLAAVGVHNAENGAKVVWPERFEESASSLTAKATLADTRATKDDETREKIIADLPGELTRIRRDIAKLEEESELMRSKTRVRDAQERLVELGLYPADLVDGKREEITLRAMSQRGEAIQREITLLKGEERQLRTSMTAPVAPVAPVVTEEGETPEIAPVVMTQADLKIELDEKAREALWAWVWLIGMLCTLEGARSLSLWALITDISAKDAQRDRDWTDELAALRHQQERAKIIAETNAAVAAYSGTPEPAPVMAAPPPPEPVEELQLVEPLVVAPPVEERSDVSQRARDAAKANAHKNKADKLEHTILVNDNRARNAERQAVKVAAQ